MRLVWSFAVPLALLGVEACGGDGEVPDAPDAQVADGGRPDAPFSDGGDAAVDASDADAGDAPDGAADGGEPPAYVAGARDRFLVFGTLVTPDVVLPTPANGVIADGELLIEGAVITCVGGPGACRNEAGARGATEIRTGGIVAPGLIDTHNHILFDIFDNDDWSPTRSYANHDEWPNEPRYQAMLDTKQCLVNDSQGKPTWCAQTPYGTAAGSLRCEVDKYGELKGLISGTTSIVGLPGNSAACFGSLARSIDVSQNGLGTDRVQTSALFPPSKSAADGVCSNFQSLTTDAYLIHCGEGTDARSRGEFDRLGAVSTVQECLFAPQTTVTHGTAFTAAEFARMAAARMKLTWSPRSNVSLYGATTDIPAALDAGVTVALGPDWSMGGSVNLLEEMRFAKSWSDSRWNGRLTARDLLQMATSHGAEVLALDPKIGRLRAGSLADIAIYGGDRTAPYDAIVAAHPRSVKLVFVGGVPLYGDRTFEAAASDPTLCERMDVCGAEKFVCVATKDASNKLNQSLATIRQNLEQALADADALTPGDGWNFSPLAPLFSCPNP